MRPRPQFSAPVALCGGVLLASVGLPLPRNGAILGLPSPCPFFHLTGLPCPACGLTRAFVCCGHGHFHDALIYHPLGPFLWLATLFFVLFSLFRGPIPAIWPRHGLPFAALLMFALWILRLGGVFPLPRT